MLEVIICAENDSNVKVTRGSEQRYDRTEISISTFAHNADDQQCAVQAAVQLDFDALLMLRAAIDQVVMKAPHREV
jgi:hypothetical protein